MKKKMLSVLMASTMLAGMLAGCGGSDSSESGSSDGEGKIINIYCWNEVK